MRSVQELEALVNERLRVELEQVQDERDRLYERISHCMELKNNMTMLQDQKRSSLKTMVDLGCSFYVQARMCAQPLRAAPGLGCLSRWTALPERTVPSVRADPTPRGCTSTWASASTPRWPRRRRSPSARSARAS